MQGMSDLVHVLRGDRPERGKSCRVLQEQVQQQERAADSTRRRAILRAPADMEATARRG